MQSSLLPLVACSLLASAAGAAVVLVLAPGADRAASPDMVITKAPEGAGDSPPAGAPDVGLAMAVHRLEAQVQELQAQLGQLASARSSAAPESVGPAEDQAAAAGAGSEAALFEEVSKVLAQIDEEKAAAEREEELEGRKDEEAKAFEEYEDVQAKLPEAIAKLSESMPMSPADQRDLQGLMDLQVERMRDLTRAWASGDFTDEEVGERFMAERNQHRQAAIALLGRERIGSYQKFIQGGGVGGRYSFYTAPWESWVKDGPSR